MNIYFGLYFGLIIIITFHNLLLLVYNKSSYIIH